LGEVIHAGFRSPDAGLPKAVGARHGNNSNLVEFMKSKAPIILLLVLCLALGVGLYIRHTKAVKQREEDLASMRALSNQWTETKTFLDEQKRVNNELETNLLVRSEELKTVSQTLSNTAATLVKTEQQAKVAAAAAAAEVAKRDTKINELEGQRDDLTKKMTDLNGSISNLEGQISATQKKLAASEGDREFLLKELKRMQTEKAELERQFNDLALMREQVRKLRDELSIARRLDWIRRGIYGTTKGAEKLSQRPTPLAPQTNYDLNVEIHQNGTATIAPQPTNAPIAKPAPASAPK
jgi:septal ring factor EnvC (AmiA/AmiB activator)